MKPIDTVAVNQSILGYWRIFAHPRARHPVDVTDFRGKPSAIASMSFSDPFGAKKASISFPQITYFERLGEGDLSWLDPMTLFEISWVGPLPDDYGYGTVNASGDPTTWWHPKRVSLSPSFTWQGRVSSFGWSDEGLSLDLQGLWLSLDDYMAKPEYPSQPLPYEWAIARQLLNHPHLKLRPLTILWPDWWDTVYEKPGKGVPMYRRPVEVHPGRNWTGLVTRETGKWDPVGTSYIQTLLSSMWTRRGRWTIDVFEDGKPVLLHRDIKHHADAETVVVDVTNANELSFDQDWTQSLGVVYGQGQSLAGVRFTGMQVSPSGAITRYEPMAYLRQVHPEDRRHNEWLDSSRARREVMLSMQEGLDELQAQQVAQAHLERFADPGLTGRLTLHEDPTINGQTVSRMLVRAGMTIRIPGVLGSTAGVLVHAVDNDVNFDEETNEVTFDSKFRDALTVSQVRLRGRDALAVPRMLAVGQYEPPIPDTLVPWDYEQGSGFIPGHATELFEEMPETTQFPWEDWTKDHPPKKAKWRKSYIRIGPASDDADDNWAFVGHGPKNNGRYGIPFRMAQAGDIRLLQVAAYDRDGNVLPVKFHISFYTNRGVNVASMPLIPATGLTYPPFDPAQHYPFVKDGWNQYHMDGTRTHPQILHPTSTAGLVRGYGDYYEGAGYWPGSESRGNVATGLLVDESTWHFDTSAGGVNVFDPYSTDQPQWAGLMYAMIYCDEQGTDPVYFLARLFRAEPGAQN